MIAARVKPKLNIYIVAVILAVVFIAIAFFLIGCGNKSDASGDNNSVSVVVHDVDVEYDGEWHTVSVENLSYGDEILFSTLSEGEYFFECPKFMYPGEYVVFYKVNRSGREVLSGSARVTIRKSILTGISAESVSVVFDGQAHGIVILGVEAGDIIEYSTDGENFSYIAPTFSEIGEYTIFYRVERVDGEYRSSSSLLVLPDLRGEYVNRRFGAIVLTDGRAEIGGSEFEMSYGVDGCGTIGDAEFSVVGGILNFNDAQYEKIDSDEKIFVISVADDKYYLHSAQGLTAEISINDNTAVVTVGDEIITTIVGVNYCENADTANHAELCFEKALSEGETALVLSERPTRTLPRKEIFHIYDGEPVDIDVEYDEVLFKTPDGFVEEAPRFCEAGEYEVEAIVLSSEYLPTVWQIDVVIAPNIGGAYYNETDAVRINGTTVWFNGNELTAEYNKNWIINGQAVEITDDGIKIGSDEFTRHTDGVIVVFEFPDRRYVAKTNAFGVKIEWTDVATAVYLDDIEIYTAPPCDRTVAVRDKIVTVIHGDDGVSFCIIGLSELYGEIKIIRIGVSDENRSFVKYSNL